jgi:hypothetical protein
MEQTLDPLALELKAMTAIGQALADLADPVARQRVLSWVAERFAVDGTASPALFAPRSVTAPVEADPGLAVDSLGDMFTSVAPDEDDEFGEFGEFGVSGEVSEVSAPAAASQALPLDVVLRSFAEDFQRFTEEWNGAAA